MVERRVSVVIPTKSRSPLLRRAVAAALAQERVELEVIVVDDGSDDDTPAMLRELADPRVVVLAHERPLGVARSRNDGLARASAPWVAFLDDDDLWSPTRLARQLDALEVHDEARWAVSGAVVVDEWLEPIGVQRPPDPSSLPGAVLRYNCIPGGASGVLADTALVREVGGFDETLRILADWDLWIRLALRAPLAVVARPDVAYVLHGANMTSRPVGLADELERIARAYGEARRSLGVEPADDAWARWFSEVARRGGARVGPARALAGVAVRRRSVQALREAFSIALDPRWVARRSAYRRRHADPAWLAEAEAWLAPSRDGGRLGRGEDRAAAAS